MTAALRVRVDRPDPETRARDLFFASFGAIFLAYSYWFPQLSTLHATLPACPFYSLTGHPCPFCGGTRSFAAMWRGDIAAAAHYYPFGPALFLLTFPVVVYGVWAVVVRRTLRFALHPRLEMGLLVGAFALLALSWALKLLWLGN